MSKSSSTSNNTPNNAQSSTPNNAQSSAPNSAQSSAPNNAQSSTPNSAQSSAPNNAQSSTSNSAQSSAPNSAQSNTPNSAQSNTPNSAQSSAQNSEQNNTVKDIYKRLYESRDLEIKNLWQRSIFLTTFLVLCFTGYGALIGKMLELECCTPCKISNIACCSGVRMFVIECCTPGKICYPNGIAILISLVGIILSILWIAMAKGSKAWYEVYERAIMTFEEEHCDELGLVFENMMGNYGVPTKDLNSCLFSTKAGAYSPSKINIVIGWVSFVLWCIAIITHVVLLIFRLCENNDDSCSYFPIVILAIIFVILLVIVVLRIICSNIKSGYLSSYIFNNDGVRLENRRRMRKTEEANK